MRKTSDIINLILDIYHGHEWQDMEEFFVIAQAILSYHGARFKMLDDIKQSVEDSIYEGVMQDFGFLSGRSGGKKRQEIFESRIDENKELAQLNKYLDSEEGFQEEINGTAKQDSVQIFHKFITFKD